MEKLTAQFKKTSGFTLVELLVVIGILAILISALLVAIDPLQQLSKGRDVQTKKAASDFVSAVSAYNLQKGKFPWDNSDACLSTDLAVAAGAAFSAKQVSLLPNCIAELKNASELRVGFLDDTKLTEKLYVSGSTATGIVKICYLPTATSNKTIELGAKYTQAGVIQTNAQCGVTNNQPISKCYVCIQ